MSGDSVANQQQNSDQENEMRQSGIEEAIQKIKQPTSIDETIANQSPDERLSNPAVVPQMSSDMRDLREDLKRD